MNCGLSWTLAGNLQPCRHLLKPNEVVTYRVERSRLRRTRSGDQVHRSIGSGIPFGNPTTTDIDWVINRVDGLAARRPVDAHARTPGPGDTLKNLRFEVRRRSIKTRMMDCAANEGHRHGSTRGRFGAQKKANSKCCWPGCDIRHGPDIRDVTHSV